MDVRLRVKQSLTRRGVLAGTTVALLALVSVAGCGPRNSAALLTQSDCTQYQKPTGTHVTSLLLILLDPTSNSQTVGADIATAVSPYLRVALQSGEYVAVLANPGNDQAIVPSSCFSGAEPFLINRANSTRQEKDMTSAMGSLTNGIEAIVRHLRVQRLGSAARLLGSINPTQTALKAVPGNHIRRVTVILWSNLLGVSGSSDCLNTNGMKASPEVAAGMVSRCLKSGQLQPIFPDRLIFLGVGYGAITAAQTSMAGFEATALCEALTTACKRA
jgi:hypothetical protein